MRLLILWKERTGNRVRDVHIYKNFLNLFVTNLIVLDLSPEFRSNAVLFPAIFSPENLWIGMGAEPPDSTEGQRSSVRNRLWSRIERNIWTQKSSPTFLHHPALTEDIFSTPKKQLRVIQCIIKMLALREKVLNSQTKTNI